MAQAMILFQRSLKIDETMLGPDHPNVATDLNNLASQYQDQGNYAEALPLYQRALQLREKVFGPDHPDVADELDNSLGVLYKDQGNYAAVLPLYQRTNSRFGKQPWDGSIRTLPLALVAWLRYTSLRETTQKPCRYTNVR